jgi:cytochrome P450
VKIDACVMGRGRFIARPVARHVPDQVPPCWEHFVDSLATIRLTLARVSWGDGYGRPCGNRPLAELDAPAPSAGDREKKIDRPLWFLSAGCAFPEESAMNTPSYEADILVTPASFADPFPLYRHFRARSPVPYQRVLPGGEIESFYALLKHADVSMALRDVETFSSRAFPAKFYLPLIMDDPPRHTQLRRRLSKAFTPKRVADLAPSIADIARELADDMGRGQVELMEAYAIPLPLRVIARIMGLPEHDYPRIRGGSQAILSPQTMAAEERAARMAELAAYLRAQIAAPRPSGAEDLIATFLDTEVDGERLPEQDMLGLLYLAIIAGHETTVHLIGNMLGILADRPDLWQKAREERALVDPIITEALRFETPIQRISRVTTRPVEVSGVPIPEGHLVHICYGAANRDPEVFADPETFRMDRPPAEHLAFGQGIHFCLGAPLARVEASITLNLLLDRFPKLSRGPEPAVRQAASLAVYGYQRLPLVLA